MGMEGQDGEDEDEVSVVEKVARRIEYTMMFRSDVQIFM